MLLLDHKANINAADRNLFTPLHWAALNGHEEVRLLPCRIYQNNTITVSTSNTITLTIYITITISITLP